MYYYRTCSCYSKDLPNLFPLRRGHPHLFPPDMKVDITLQAVKIFDEHEPGDGPGGIFITIQKNNKDKIRYPSEGGYEIKINQTWNLEYEYTLILSQDDVLKIELRETAPFPDDDDSLGYITFSFPWKNMTSQTYITSNPPDAEIRLSLVYTKGDDAFMKIVTFVIFAVILIVIINYVKSNQLLSRF